MNSGLPTSVGRSSPVNRMEAVQHLNYAPKPTAAQRFWRRIYRLVLAAALLAVALTWGPGLLRRGEELYWLQKCLTFQQPAAHAVFEMNRFNVLHSEICLPRNRFMGAPITPDYTIFLHGMHRPDGAYRLVLLSFTWQPQLALTALQYLEWTVSLSPKLSNWNYITAQTFSGRLNSHWKFFAGQPDPNNASHFTFDYELDGTRHSCDAWLKNDGQLIVSQRP